MDISLAHALDVLAKASYLLAALLFIFGLKRMSSPVTARAGIVLQVETGYRGGSLDYARDAARANFIRILHDDGTMALYGHLAPDGAQVVPGQRVEVGQRIGSSGNTGYSSAPHLHFVVQVNRGGQLVSIAFRMQGGRSRRAAEPAHSSLPPARTVSANVRLRLLRS